MLGQMQLDAHARPPEPVKALFKRWQKSSVKDIDSSDDLIDFARTSDKQYGRVRETIGLSRLQVSQTFEAFMRTGKSLNKAETCEAPSRYEITDLPGLFVYPSLLPTYVQLALLSKVLHRDLSNPRHKSNLHLHYEIGYPQHSGHSDGNGLDKSFFLADQRAILSPIDSAVHKPLTVKQMLERKLRWVTLGGQYDWTAKVYPEEVPPRFPEDIANLLKGLFPDVDAQAAIVNFYTPGDTLSVHRDVSEECDRGLISLSIGCDGLFVVSNDDGSHSATVRLRSGDVLLMSGPSRYAWHAVPKILPNTCPEWLQAWPAVAPDTSLDVWKGWMANKRINLNVRQMRA